MEERGEQVQLYVYDVSMGMARLYSQMFVGRQLEGIWHTGVVVYGIEFFWGGELQEGRPGQTPFGTPVKRLPMGTTYIPIEVLRDYIQEARNRYSVDTYRLLSNNCNNFSQEIVQFLTGNDIPQDIRDLPQEALSNAAHLRPLIESMENMMRQPTTATGPSFMPFGMTNPFMGNVNPTANMFPMGNTGTPNVTTNSPQTPSVSIPKPTVTVPTAPINKVSKVSMDSLKIIRLKEDNAFVSTASGPTMLAKLKQNLAENAQFAQDAKYIDLLGDYLSKTENALHSNDAPPSEIYSLFDKLVTEFPVTKMFAAMFLFRLLILRKSPNEYYAKQGSKTLVTIFGKYLKDDVPKPVTVMSLTLISNLFYHNTGTQFIVSNITSVLPFIVKSLNSSDVPVRTTSAAIVYNFSLVLKESNEHAISCVKGALNSLQLQNDEEMLFRLLMAIGHFAYNHWQLAKTIEDLGWKSIFARMQVMNIQKIKDISNDVNLIVNSYK